jgi:hypothetical protein
MPDYGTQKGWLPHSEGEGQSSFSSASRGRTTVGPVHSGESLGPGLLAKVLRDVEITRNELEELLA